MRKRVRQRGRKKMFKLLPLLKKKPGRSRRAWTEADKAAKKIGGLAAIHRHHP